MITTLLVVAAMAYLLWPAVKAPAVPAASDLFRVQPPAPASTTASPQAPDPRAAIDSLLEVRDRLAATDSLDDASAKAVDTLWLDLLHGSQRK